VLAEEGAARPADGERGDGQADPRRPPRTAQCPRSELQHQEGHREHQQHVVVLPAPLRQEQHREGQQRELREHHRPAPVVAWSQAGHQQPDGQGHRSQVQEAEPRRRQGQQVHREVCPAGRHRGDGHRVGGEAAQDAQQGLVDVLGLEQGQLASGQVGGHHLLPPGDVQLEVALPADEEGGKQDPGQGPEHHAPEPASAALPAEEDHPESGSDLQHGSQPEPQAGPQLVPPEPAPGGGRHGRAHDDVQIPVQHVGVQGAEGEHQHRDHRPGAQSGSSLSGQARAPGSSPSARKGDIRSRLNGRVG